MHLYKEAEKKIKKIVAIPVSTLPLFSGFSDAIGGGTGDRGVVDSSSVTPPPPEHRWGWPRPRIITFICTKLTRSKAIEEIFSRNQILFAEMNKSIKCTDVHSYTNILKIKKDEKTIM